MAKIEVSMAGNLWKLLKKQGDQVETGEEVAILESMKMEIPIESVAGGQVKMVLKGEGDFVDEGETILEIE
ncbi:acetyl-CoA carboxylase biotin carboxyl carrier protein subunit [Salicibibacter cibarius]|uniref:Acetyl-CoA carboxylase biotin carboxyl carrier protein subunit n=1 Tax=Salicibibacter cibarius TaxID=2743000 RepID=A0A7T6Z6J6_9BACI|nr:acetyl-CoA carboxylase biotin carboxyl carrier protein subunit [Salicibibacter cibarius]QQK77800.1 acetyl-CoA carboxylase biotin carboxyl carrier protein subunit [Salicibibacter cibarius]